MLDFNQLKVGDVLLFHGEHLLARSIQDFSKSKYNHAALYIGHGLLIEATGAGVEINPLASLLKANTYMCVRRVPRLTRSAQKKLEDKVPGMVDENYDFVQILTLGLYFAIRNTLGISIDWLVKDNPNRIICSVLVATLLKSVGVQLSTRISLVTPDTLFHSQKLRTILKYDTREEKTIWQNLSARFPIPFR